MNYMNVNKIENFCISSKEKRNTKERIRIFNIRKLKNTKKNDKIGF